MTYLGEIRTHWRSLAAASFGLTAGYSITNYTNNIFTPHLLEQFDWSKSDIAFVGVAVFLAVIVQPIAGRLTDTLGVRRMAMIGVASAPLMFVGLSAMTGDLSQFILLSVLQIIVVGGTTSATIYSRLIAQKFDRARGIALAIAACSPALVGAASVPFLSNFIDVNGWRAGYVAVAVGVAIAGVIAILLIPAGADLRRNVEPVGNYPSRGHGPSRGYGAIVRDPSFQLIIAGMFLCNLSFSMQTSQLKVVLLDKGIDSATGSVAISLFAFGVIAARFLCGIALDRFPSYAVAAISLGLPCIGLGILASGLSSSWVIAVAVLSLGLALGAEGDVLAYLVMKYFRLDIYSTVLGMVLGAIALSAASGSLLLSFMLKRSGNYSPFLVVSAVAALIGSAMFVQLRRVPTYSPAHCPDVIA